MYYSFDQVLLLIYICCRSGYQRRPSFLVRCAHAHGTSLNVFPFVSRLIDIPNRTWLCMLLHYPIISKQQPRMAHLHLTIFAPYLQGSPLKGYCVVATSGTWFTRLLGIKAEWTDSSEQR